MDWDIFEHQDLDTYTGTFLGYIKFCMNAVSDRTIWDFPNQKPWMTSQVRSSWPEKKKKIKEAKADYTGAHHVVVTQQLEVRVHRSLARITFTGYDYITQVP